MRTGLDYSDIYELGVESDCCGASVVWVDLCTECREHCTPVDLDTGKLMDDYRDAGMRPGEFFRQE